MVPESQTEDIGEIESWKWIEFFFFLSVLLSSCCGWMGYKPMGPSKGCGRIQQSCSLNCYTEEMGRGVYPEYTLCRGWSLAADALDTERETAECWARSCRTQVLRWAVVNMPWWQLSQGGGTKASRAPAVLGQWLFPSFASCWSPCCFYSSVNCSTQTAKWAVFPTCSLPVERPYFTVLLLCFPPAFPRTY